MSKDQKQEKTQEKPQKSQKKDQTAADGELGESDLDSVSGGSVGVGGSDEDYLRSIGEWPPS